MVTFETPANRFTPNPERATNALAHPVAFAADTSVLGILEVVSSCLYITLLK